MYLTFLLLRYIIDRHLEYVRMGGICSGIEVAITRTIRNRLTVDPVRGFESHPLRHVGASCISLAPTFSKVRARSLRCSSFPNRTRFAGLRFGFGRNLERKSILTPYSKKRDTHCVSLFLVPVFCRRQKAASGAGRLESCGRDCEDTPSRCTFAGSIGHPP